MSTTTTTTNDNKGDKTTLQDFYKSIAAADAKNGSMSNLCNIATTDDAKTHHINNNTNPMTVSSFMARSPKVHSHSGHLRAARSKSTDQDENYLENIKMAKDRRVSWQQLRNERSYIPSLSVICKLKKSDIFLLKFFIFFFKKKNEFKRRRRKSVKVREREKKRERNARFSFFL